jgi:hypothetical protein
MPYSFPIPPAIFMIESCPLDGHIQQISLKKDSLTVGGSKGAALSRLACVNEFDMLESELSW